ncbi:MAG: ABC transporter ATP-binding protein [Rhodovibrionaceae bacterium]
MLEVSGLEAGYGEVHVLEGIDLAVEEGSITAVIGSNGAGKTTLMRALSGLLVPKRGTIRFAGEEITVWKPSQRVERGLVLVPEGRLIFPDLSVADTLRLGAYGKQARAGWRERLGEIYELFPRLAERRHTRGGSLSGGEQQMLALGRGLMSCPKLLLLDEPSLGLAPVMARHVFDAIRRISESGITVCLVEQDVHATLELADYGYVLENGRVAAQDSGSALLASPRIKESYLGL